MTARPCFFAMAMIGSMSAGDPPICTAMRAFVRSVIAASISAGSRLNVASSISTNTGTAPAATTELAVATNVYGGTITSCPGSTPTARNASSSAVVPLASGTAYSASWYSRIISAALLVHSPPVPHLPLSMTAARFSRKPGAARRAIPRCVSARRR